MTDETPQKDHLKPLYWMGQGCFLLGIVIGILAGMSVSPIVATVVSLLFAFTGGSIIVLIKGRSAEELRLIGLSVSTLAIGIIIGVVTGVSIRANDLLKLSNQAAESALFKLSSNLTVHDILELNSEKQLDNDKLYALLQVTAYTSQQPVSISKQELIAIIKTDISSDAIRDLFLVNDASKNGKNRAMSSALYGIEKDSECGKQGEIVVKD